MNELALANLPWSVLVGTLSLRRMIYQFWQSYVRPYIMELTLMKSSCCEVFKSIDSRAVLHP